VRQQEGEKNKGARKKQIERTSQAIEYYGAFSRGGAGERPGRVPEILVVGELSAPFYDCQRGQSGESLRWLGFHTITMVVPSRSGVHLDA
jgi:hypothetical protein